ncbi:MAG: dihydrofolate reductase [Thermoanaerobaculia bacterium]|nr:dihydrofolate reductase [Thermoanaerobaculia bacterium]
MRSIEMIVAMAENGVIGRDGDLPWRLSGDLRHFKRLTTGHSLLMGRRTWESLPGVLPKRRHIVLSRNVSRNAPLPTSLVHAGSIAEAVEYFLESAGAGERLFAIGGAGIYEQVWDLSSELHLTRVHAQVEGDTYFPSLDLRHWFKRDSQRHEVDDRNDYPFTIEHWTRDQDPTEVDVSTCGDVGWEPIRRLLADFALQVQVSEPGRPIPATFWGEPEAGIRGDVVFARDDTPIHSLLHEACHAILVDDERRADLDIDAGGDQQEEDAVCVLQMLLADRLPGVGRKRVAADMDAWGYSFLAGSATGFLERDAVAAWDLLRNRLGADVLATISSRNPGSEPASVEPADESRGGQRRLRSPNSTNADELADVQNLRPEPGAEEHGA